MSNITTRSGKGAPLSHSEIDQNFLNLNTDKYQSGDSASFNNLTITGNLTVTGTTTTVDSTNLSLSDSLIYLATGNTANANDIGIVGHFTSGSYQHTGIARDATDGKWKLFSGIVAEPSSTVDFSSWVKDTLVLGQVDATSLLLNGSSSGSLTLQAPATASGALTLPAATDTLVGRATTDTLTNKTLSLSNNTLSGTLAQLNSAISDADVAAVTHKYHEFTVGSYYYDSYQQSRYLRVFTENAAFDNARFAAVTNVEYHNGTAWVAWVGGDATVKNLLDGRQNTYADIDHTHRRFRFTIDKNSGWPTDCLIGVYMDWFGNAWTNFTLTIEDTADQVSWTTKETLTFGAGTTNSDYGWHAYQSGSLHNGRTLNRITFDVTDWVDSGSYVTKRFNSFSIFSNYNGAAGTVGVPATWDYTKQIYTLGGLTTANDTGSTLTIGRFNSSDTTSYLDTTTSATAMFLRVNYYPVIRLVRRDSVNYTQFTGGISGEAVTIAAQGSDANVGMIVQTKGTGDINFWTGTTAASQVRIIDNAGADRPLTLAGGKSGATGARIGVTNEALDFYTSGGYSLFFSTNGIRSATQFVVAPTSSAVNWVQVTGSTTAAAVTVSAQGSDAAIPLTLSAKGNSALTLQVNGATQLSIGYGGTANRAFVYGSGTGASVVYTASGTDTDIGVKLMSKGAGAVEFNVPTQLGALLADTRVVTNTVSYAGNALYLRNWLYRHTAGSDWTGASMRLGQIVDVTAMSYIEFNPVGQAQGLALVVANSSPLQVKTTGGEQLRVLNTASAVNFMQVTGGINGVLNSPTLSVAGTDTNIDINYTAKGIGSHRFNSGTVLAFIINSQASAANYGAFTATSAGTSPLLQVAGSDTNIDFRLRTQGTGSYQFDTGSNSNTQLKVVHTASAVNWVQVSGAATTTAPLVSAQGSDTHVGLSFRTKNAGAMTFTKYRDATTGSAYLFEYAGGLNSDANGGAFWRGWHIGAPTYTVSAANKFPRLAQYFELQSAADPTYKNAYFALGNCAGENIELMFSNESGGGWTFRNGSAHSSTEKTFRIGAPLSTHVNYIQVDGAATGSSPTVSSKGSDANLGLRVVSKGTGDINLMTAGGLNQAVIRHGGDGTNFLGLRGSNTGIAVSISAEGTDTNIDLEAKSKGDGVFYVNAPAVKLTDAASAPATTEMRLYSVNGVLHYNGTEIGTGGGAPTGTIQSIDAIALALILG